MFEKNDSMIKDDNSYQYKCYNELKPIDIVKVRFKDFEQFFEIRTENNNKTN